jgi:hypothetical protein
MRKSVDCHGGSAAFLNRDVEISLSPWEREGAPKARKGEDSNEALRSG